MVFKFLITGVQIKKPPSTKKSGRRYTKGERKGKTHVSGKRVPGARRGRNFLVVSPMLIEIGARYSVKCIGANEFEVEKRLNKRR